MRPQASLLCLVRRKRPSQAGPGLPRKLNVQSKQQAPREAAHPDGLEAPRRYWAVTTILVGILFASLDMTMLNVALPEIARDMAIDPGLVVWIVIAYSLVIVVTLLPLSVVSERMGSQ